MPDTNVKLLIVDDEALLRTSLSAVFTASGHSVRSAEDGFSALGQIRNEIPDIILSDLNMPGMSGFELLSVVRRRFPSIGVIAMSGAFSGDAVPTGIAADAFYGKGGNPRALMEIVRTMARKVRKSVQHSTAMAPMWIPKNGHDPAGVEYVTITCPDCLRTFTETPGNGAFRICETTCVHCSSAVCYAIVQATDATPQQTSLRHS